MFENEVILITGGAGFIGSHICDFYAKYGAKKVVIYDNLSSGYAKYVAEIADKYDNLELSLVIGDIMDREHLEDVMKFHNVTMCNHHAAQLEITKCVEFPEYDIDINLIGTLNVLKAMVNANVKTLVNASSACVYGQNDNNRPSSETLDFPNPHWTYGMSKHAAEQLITIFCHDYGLKAVSFRYSIVMGVREWFGRVGTMFLKRAIGGDKLVIFGDGKQIRDIIDVEDAALASIKAYEFINNMDDGKHEVFNISSQVPYTINTIAETVLKVVYGFVDRDMILYEDPKPGEFSTIIQDRVRIPNELRTMWLDNSKMSVELGIFPVTDLNSLLIKESEWLLSDPKMWDSYHI